MFKKKPAIKTLSPLKSSDRRRTADRIISDYQLDVPAENPEDPESKAAATAAHTSLRNSLLPENSLSAKFTTTAGPNLKEVTGVVYVGSHGGSDQRVLWIKLEERLYPSVYTLWQNPGILPLLHTPSIVVSKLKGGADLMTPGLARGPPFPTKATKGAIVAIASMEVPTVPVAVGFCEIDISQLQQVRGAKGHAVEIIHCDGDEVWAWSPAGKLGIPAPESIDGWDSEDMQEIQTSTENLNVNEADDDEGGVPLNKAPESAVTAPQSTESQPLENGSADVEAEEAQMTTKEIDDAFYNAFLYGVYQHKQEHKGDPKHGLTFPLNQSFVMSTLVLPFLPKFTPKQADMLIMKKTSWKNIRKFIKHLDKQKLVLTKDRDGNEVVILDIDFEDPAFQTFVPYRLPKKENSSSNGGEGSSENTGDSSIGQELKRIEVYRPRGSLLPLFKSPGSDSRYYTAADIKSLIVTYIEANNLVKPSDKRLVSLDPTLSNCVFSSDSAFDRETAAKGACARPALIDRVVQGCTPFHVILKGDEKFETTKSKPKAGEAPKVQIVMETRSGNKTVTRVHGLETYFISPQPMADELRKVCASSTAIEPFKGGKGMEILVQGPQKDAIVAALEKRGVHKSWIEAQDKRKGKK